MRICTQCKIEKEISEFPKSCKSWCKRCCCEKVKAYRIANPEKVKATREKRKEKALEKAREYKEKHKKTLAKKQKIYYLENQEDLIEKSRNWYKNNKKRQLERNKEYRKEWSKTENAKKYRRATKAVYKAVKNGMLKKPDKCTLCFKETRLEAHHHDYEKLLEVVWVCKRCHGKLHRKF